jgi:hypothetical protein
LESIKQSHWEKTLIGRNGSQNYILEAIANEKLEEE